jgi:hypothetical protein
VCTRREWGEVEDGGVKGDDERWDEGKIVFHRKSYNWIEEERKMIVAK